jgi:protein-tyrosine phosphatase
VEHMPHWTDAARPLIASAMKDRIHSFDGIRNFRDFGGYASRYGGQVKSGTLFRSGHYGEASAGDLKKIEAFNIHLQADLRRPDERERQPGKWSAPHTLTHAGGRESEAPHVRFLSEMHVGPNEAEGWMVEYYRAAPFKAHHQALFRGWFDALETLPENAAALVNCAAGKDRTGILCALTHHVLGVSQDDIRKDYELTNVAAEVDQRLEAMASQFNTFIGKSYPAEVYRPFMGVRLHYLETAFACIHEASGSVDAYLTDTLGVTDARQKTLRARLLAA